MASHTPYRGRILPFSSQVSPCFLNLFDVASCAAHPQLLVLPLTKFEIYTIFSFPQEHLHNTRLAPFWGAASPITVRRPKTSPVFTKYFLFCGIIKNPALPQIWFFVCLPVSSPVLAPQVFSLWVPLPPFPQPLVLHPQTHTRCL